MLWKNLSVYKETKIYASWKQKSYKSYKRYGKDF